MEKRFRKNFFGNAGEYSRLLSYLLRLVRGIIFYIIEKENKFVRFHAVQSTVVCGFLFVLYMILRFIPILGWSLNILILWIILMIKAYQGEYFKFPVVGEITERNA